VSVAVRHPHRHLAEGELFYVLGGAVKFTMDGETRIVGAGESVFVPRRAAHAYVNDGEMDARMIAIYTPAGMEGWFLEVCTPVTDTAASPPPVTPELIERAHARGGTSPPRRVALTPPDDPVTAADRPDLCP
jgi:hypothetical protein